MSHADATHVHLRMSDGSTARVPHNGKYGPGTITRETPAERQAAHDSALKDVESFRSAGDLRKAASDSGVPGAAVALTAARFAIGKNQADEAAQYTARADDRVRKAAEAGDIAPERASELHNGISGLHARLTGAPLPDWETARREASQREAARQARAEQVSAILGSHLQSDGSPTAAAHLKDLGHVPDPLLHAVKQHGVKLVLTRKSTGDAEPALGSTPARGHGGTTFKTVPGAYMPATRTAVLGNSGGHGSSSLALHEFSHAADDVLGKPSQAPRFKMIYSDLRIAFGPRLQPYYRQPGDDTASRQEMFAEMLGAWMLHSGDTPDSRQSAMLAAVGLHAGGAPEAGLMQYAAGEADLYFSELTRQEA